MIDHTLDIEHGILHVRPTSALEQSDFLQLSAAADPFINQQGDLTGLIIESPGFPGWDSFGALVSHIRFVRDHHKHIRKVALVTDSPIGNLGEHLASHFVAAEIRHFPFSEADAARQWILT